MTSSDVTNTATQVTILIFYPDNKEKGGTFDVGVRQVL